MGESIHHGMSLGLAGSRYSILILVLSFLGETLVCVALFYRLILVYLRIEILFRLLVSVFSESVI